MWLVFGWTQGPRIRWKEFNTYYCEWDFFIKQSAQHHLHHNASIVLPPRPAGWNCDRLAHKMQHSSSPLAPIIFTVQHSHHNYHWPFAVPFPSYSIYRQTAAANENCPVPLNSKDQKCETHRPSHTFFPGRIIIIGNSSSVLIPRVQYWNCFMTSILFGVMNDEWKDEEASECPKEVETVAITRPGSTATTPPSSSRRPTRRNYHYRVRTRWWCARDDDNHDDDAGLRIVKQKPFCKVDSLFVGLPYLVATYSRRLAVVHQRTAALASSSSSPYYGFDRPSTSTGPFSALLLLHHHHFYILSAWSIEGTIMPRPNTSLFPA